MRSHTRLHTTRADLDRLLDGRPGEPDNLSGLLDAARGTVRATEVTGLDAARMAFARASLASIPKPERNASMMESLTHKIRAVKLLAVGGVALAATGGIALASTGGGFPAPFAHSSHAAASASRHGGDDPSDASSSSTESSTASSSAASGTDSESDTDAAKPTSSESHAPGVPSPSLTGLCHAWLARPHLHGKADSSAAFTVLVKTAGGTAQVNAYCTALLNRTPSSSASSSTASSSVTPSAEPTRGKPTSAPSHPTGKSDHPSGKSATTPPEVPGGQ
jgi:hypothetical protein